jgi:DNA-binding Lrp family transcriptional regulator
MNALGLSLLNDFQRAFPLVSRPFQVLAEACGTTENEVLRTLRDSIAHGSVSRVGAVFAPGRIGASTLAALQVPPHRLDQVAAAVSARPEINHNYAREHAFNLWFVAAGAEQAALDRLLGAIAADTQCALLDLPLVQEYRIDLGFDLTGRHSKVTPPARTNLSSFPLSEPERRLLCALQDGLELVAQPFQALARAAALTERGVLRTIERWVAQGTIRRFGVIVRHHELGYRANAMAVWDVPDVLVDELGRRAACVPGVTLAYRRRRQLPAWPYNLFCMVHGKQRSEALATVREVTGLARLGGYSHAVLFSCQRFKQCGVRYLPRESVAAHG